MTEWCMAHPWMTFFIICTLIGALPRINIRRRHAVNFSLTQEDVRSLQDAIDKHLADNFKKP